MAGRKTDSNVEAAIQRVISVTICFKEAPKESRGDTGLPSVCTKLSFTQREEGADTFKVFGRSN